MVEPSGENCTALIDSPNSRACAFCFSAFSSKDAAASVGALRLRLGEGSGGLGVPASHTLSVLSLEPETMVLPSGEKATERT